MDKQEILARVDHPELNPSATWEDIRTLCDDAVTYGTKGQNIILHKRNSLKHDCI